MNPKPLAGCTIVFDLDGTLVDSAPDLVGALNTILAEHGHPAVRIEDARDMIGRGAKKLLERGFAMAGASIEEARMPALFDRFIDIYLGRIARESRPFDGVVETLDALAGAGAALVVCTNKRTDLAVALLDSLGLSARFEAVVGPDMAPAAKPDPSHLLTAIEMAGGRPGRALMVGDSASDVDAAKAAGVPVVLVSFGYSDVPIERLHRDLLIDRFADLTDAAFRLLSPGAQAACPDPVAGL